MGYIGRGLNTGQYSKLDSIAGSFDGSVTTFSLEQNGTAVTPSAQNCLISLGGVIQEPFVAFSVTGSILNFTEAPATDDTFFGIVMGEAAFIAGNTVGQNELQAPSSIASYIGNEITGSLGANASLIRSLTGAAISGSVVSGVSGSATSTGSFGRVEVAGDLAVTGNYGHSIEMFYPSVKIDTGIGKTVSFGLHYLTSDKQEGNGVGAFDEGVVSGIAPTGFSSVSGLSVWGIANSTDAIIIQVGWHIATDDEAQDAHSQGLTEYGREDPPEVGDIYQFQGLNAAGSNDFEDLIEEGDAFGFRIINYEAGDFYTLGMTITWEF